MGKYKFGIKSGYMVVSDPYYDLKKVANTHFKILSVESGEWEIKSTTHYRDIAEEECKLMTSITIKHIDIEPSESKYSKDNLGYISVGSGHVCFCDLKSYRIDDHIRDDELWERYNLNGTPGEKFYSRCCQITKAGYGVFNGGCVTNTGGFGDGRYRLTGKRSCSGSLVEITIMFN